MARAASTGMAAFTKNTWAVNMPMKKGQPIGMEIPSTHFELWDAPETLMKHAARDTNLDADAFRETFALAHSILDTTP